MEKPHEAIDEGTVKKPRLEKCIPPLGNSAAMHSSDLCDSGSTSVQAKSNGDFKEPVEQTTKPNVAVEGNQCITIEPDDSVMDADKIVWLKMCRAQLSEADRMTLLTFGCQLNDKHVNLAQKLLRNQFPNIKGLTSTLTQTQGSQAKINSVIQIIFCHRNHWITVSNVNSSGSIMVYDSVYTCISEEVKGIILSLFYYDDSTSLSLAPMQKQEPGSNNCGIFAVAAATANVFSCNPSELQLRRVKCKNTFVNVLKMG